jgi:penicillin amidase
VPLAADVADAAWAGFIPAGQMPGGVNPARGWVGTANHRTLPAGYPYAYSNYFAASWRYRRMIELIDPPGRHAAAAHWRFMWDSHNLMAARTVPILQRALAAHADTADLARRLGEWNLEDEPNEVGPSIFQSVVRHFAELTFRDELGEELTHHMLGAAYYWQERLVQLMQDNSTTWFDDKTTSAIETRDDMIHRAGLLAIEELSRVMGQDPAGWRWGRIHTVTFFSPTLPGHWPAQFLGGGTRPKEGSGETLNRAAYKFEMPYEVTYIASMRFLADLGDSDKVMMVLSGGASGRQFDSHLKDELPAWRSGAPGYLWFSTAQIDAHAQHELRLSPEK